MIYLWVMLYGISYSIAKYFSPLVGGEEWAVALVMLLYCIAFILWTIHTKQHQMIGLCLPVAQPQMCLHLIPLMTLPILNLTTGTVHTSTRAMILLTLSLSTAEELFFRGYLLAFLRKWGLVQGAALTSIVFALFHGVNLLQDADVTYVLMQILCAFFVSIYYCVATIQLRSLIPCIIAHFFTNITGVDAIQGDSISSFLWTYVAICALYDIWLCCRIGCSREESIQ